jgi:adenylate cyclase
LLGGVAALLTFVAVWSLDPAGLATAVRERAFDVLLTLFPRGASGADVRVVDIDRRALDTLGPWPLPRAKIAALVQRLAKDGASIVAFDIYFADADQRSSRSLAQSLMSIDGGAELAAKARELPDSDLAFANALAQAPTVLGAIAAPSERPQNFSAIAFAKPVSPEAVKPVSGFTPPYDVLADAALGIGVLSLFGEDGGRIRKVPLVLSDGARAAPGLAVEAARIATATSLLEVSAGEPRLAFAQGSMPIDEAGSMRLHWSDPAHWQARTVSAADVLKGAIAPGSFAGAIVLIGSSAPETGSLRPTAVGPLTPSVEIEADAVEQLLALTSPQRPKAARAIEALAGLALGGLAAASAAAAGPLVGLGATAVLIAVWIGAVFACFSRHVLLDPIGPAMAMAIAANVAAAFSFARTRSLKALITQRFAQYLAPEVVSQIVARPEQLKRAGEARSVTALFTDVEGFTAMTKRLGPAELIALLDPYLDGLCRVALRHRGMINGFAGDAVQVFFNVPLEQPGHADAALQCALEMRQFAERFGERDEAQKAGFGRTHIGLETGEAIVGDVGGSQRLNYTAYGDAINLAARLAANRQLAATICVGPGAAAAITPGRLTHCAVLKIRGFDNPVAIYCPVGAGLTAPIEALPQYAADPKLSDSSAAPPER